MKVAAKNPAAKSAKSNTSFFQKRNGQGFFNSNTTGSSFFGRTATAVQPKLTVGQPNDKYEREADATADKVVQRLATPEKLTNSDQGVQAKTLVPSVSSFVQTKCSDCEQEEKLRKKEEGEEDMKEVQRKPIFESNAESGEEEVVQRKCAHCEEEDKNLQRKETSAGEASASSSVESKLSSSKGTGSQLPQDVNRSMSHAFGSDFSHVRVHTNDAAAEMNKDLHAQAFTHGSDIYFNAGKYDTTSKGGKDLLAHELTHTVQQGKGQQKNKVQRNGTGGTSPAPVVPPGPPYIIKGIEFDPSQNAKTLKIPKISLPDFKKRNSEKFKWPVHTLKGRPPTRQVANWEEGVKGATNAKVAAFLSTVQKPAGDVYFLKAKNSEYRLFGTKEQIQSYCYIPEWNRKGLKNLHQVDHIVEMQLGGEDNMNNYEVTDATANNSSGTNIKNERLRRIAAARKELVTGNVPNVPDKDQISENFVVIFNEIDNWNLSYAGDGKVYWIRKDIEDGNHLNHLRGMTAAEIAQSQGSPNELVLYVNERSGSPLRIPIPFTGTISNWLPGIDVTSCTHNPSAADNKSFGTIGITLNKNFTDSLKSSGSFNIAFNKTPGLINTGYLQFTKDQRAISDLLRFQGLSPITIEEFRLDEKLGMVLRGKIKTNISLFDGAEIDFSLEGKNITLSKTFSLGEVKGFPKPFKVTDVSIGVFASTEFGFGVEGNLDFEITKLGKGFVKGVGATKQGFMVTGKFEFESKKFKGSNISFTYKDKKWEVTGEVKVTKGNFTGIEEANLTIKYADEKVTFGGFATLDVPGVEKFTLNGEFKDASNFWIHGTAGFKKMPGIKSGTFDVEVTNNADEINFKGTGTAKPSLPKMPGELDSTLTISYDSKTEVFKAEGEFVYKKGRLDGKVKIGVTNSAVKDAELLDKKGDKFVFYGKGSLTITLIEGKAKVDLIAEVKPGGELFISAKATLSPTKLMETYSKDKKIPFPSLKIPLVGVPFVSIFLEIGGGVKIYFNWDPLTIGGSITLPETDIMKLAKAKFGININASSTAIAGAGMEISVKVGAEAAVLQIKGGVEGFAGLEVKGAIGADLNMELDLEKGLVVKDLLAKIEVKPYAKFGLTGVVGVYLNLFFTTIDLWEYKKVLAEGSIDLSSLGGLEVTVPVKFDKNGNIILPGIEDIQFKKPEFSAEKGKELMNAVFNDKKTEDPAKEAETKQKIRDAISKELRSRLRPDQPARESFDVNKIAADVQNKLANTDKAFSAFIIESTTGELKTIANEVLENLRKQLMGSTEPLLVKLAKVDEYERQWELWRDKTMTPILREELKKEDASRQTSSVQRKPIFENEDEKALQEKMETGFAADGSDPIENSLNASREKGNRLPGSVQKDLQPSFNTDLSKVNIHTDEEAHRMSDALYANAFTQGNDIYFNAGKFDTTSKGGKHLLAHELTHVAQQNDSNGSAGHHNISRNEKEDNKPVTPLAPAPGAFRMTLMLPEGGGFIELSENRKHVRYQLEQQVIRKGRGCLAKIAERMKDGINIIEYGKTGKPDYDAPWKNREPLVNRLELTPQEEFHLQKSKEIEAVMNDVISELNAEFDVFMDSFKKQMEANALQILKVSEERTKSEFIRYGLVEGVNWEDRGIFYGDPGAPALKGLRQGAVILQKRKKPFDVKKAQIKEYVVSLTQNPAWVFDYSEHKARLTKLFLEQAELEKTYKQILAYLSTEYPVLGYLGDIEEDGLDFLDWTTVDDNMVLSTIIGTRVQDQKDNIDKCKKGIEDHQINFWRLPHVIDFTLFALKAKDNPLQKKLVEDKVEDEKPGIVQGIALLVMDAVALLLAGPTAGVSLGVAAGVNIAIAAHDVDEYLMQKAEANTDFDKAHSLSADDPSLFWLAISLAGVIPEVGNLAKAFRGISKAIKNVRILKTAKAIEEMEDVIRAIGKEHKLADDVIENIVRTAKNEEDALRLIGLTTDEIGGLKKATAVAENLDAAAGIVNPVTKAEVKISGKGLIFSCTSPCTVLRDKYAKQLAHDASLLDELKVLEREAAEAATDEAKKIVAQKASELEAKIKKVPLSSWKSPLADSPEFDNLVSKRGSITPELDVKPDGWTGSMEAEFRYGKQAKAEKNYRWVLQEDGTLRYDRLDETLPKRRFDTDTMTFKELPPKPKSSSIALEAQAELEQLAHLGKDAASAGELYKRIRKGVPQLKHITDEGLERIMRLAPNIDHMKGQLLEEMAGLAARKSKAKGGIEFIAGHNIRDAAGQQLTDGILIRRRKGGIIEVVGIIESKAGKASSEGLKRSYKSFSSLSEKEIAALRMDAIEELRVRKGLDTGVIDELPPKPLPAGATTKNLTAISEDEVQAVMKEMHTSDMGQIEKDFERMMPGANEKYVQIQIGDKTVKVDVSPSKTKVYTSTPSDVVAEAAENVVGRKIATEALDIGVTSEELIQLARQLRAEQIVNASKIPVK